MPGVLTNGMMAPRIGSTGPGEAPPPSLGDQFAAAFRLGTDDSGWAEDTEKKNGYLEIYDALAGDMDFGDRLMFGNHAPVGRNNYDGFGAYVWAALEKRRASDPKFMPGIPATQAEYEQQLLDRQKVRRAADKGTTARGTGAVATATQFAGSIASSFTDPWNVATLPIGAGGKTILQAAARNAGLNGLIEALEQPLVAAHRERLGEELTATEAIVNVGAAAGFGGLLGGGLKALDLHGGAAREAVLAKIYERLPDAVRSRIGQVEDVPDSALADLLEDALGKDNLTPDERAAVHVMRREDEIAATNPFVRNGAGIAAHADNLRAAMEHILADVPVASRPALRASTAIRSGTVDMSAAAVVKRRIGVVENASGSNSARPIGRDGRVMSSALGKYQFTIGTWNALYKRRYGAQGLSDAAIAAKRADPRLQDTLMDDLMTANGAALRRAGQAQTPGNLYLAHFAGSDGAIRLLEADPAARAADVLGEQAARANPWMKNMTAAELLAWAERKMGQAYPSPRGGERVEIAGGDPESGLQRQLQDELDRLEGQRLALEQGGERPPIVDPDDLEVVPVDLGDDIPLPAMPRAAPVRRAPLDLFQFIASKGGIADAEGHDLKGMFGRNPFVPGMGMLVRDGGMAIDRARELAVEAGYFGDPRRTDVTVDDLLQAMDRQARGQERHFVPRDLAEVEARRQRIQQSEDYGEFDQRLRDAAGLRGIDDLDEDDALRAFELWDGESFEATLDRVIGEHLDQAHMDVLAEYDPDVYRQRRREEEQGYGARPPEDGSDPGYAFERPADGGDAGEGRAGVADGGSPAAVSRAADDGADLLSPELTPEADRALWDEPDGKGAEWQADSLDHDFRAALHLPDTDDPNIAARQRQEAQLAADAPLRGGAKTGQAQDGTMGLGLFDAADQPGFRLEEEGGTIDPAKLMAELDAEEAAIKGMKDCL